MCEWVRQCAPFLTHCIMPNYVVSDDQNTASARAYHTDEVYSLSDSEKATSQTSITTTIEMKDEKSVAQFGVFYDWLGLFDDQFADEGDQFTRRLTLSITTGPTILYYGLDDNDVNTCAESWQCLFLRSGPSTTHYDGRDEDNLCRRCTSLHLWWESEYSLSPKRSITRLLTKWHRHDKKNWNFQKKNGKLFLVQWPMYDGERSVDEIIIKLIWRNAL